jgi:cell division protein FtsL
LKKKGGKKMIFKAIFVMGVICSGLFLILLLVVNYVDRLGLEDYEKLNGEIVYYSESLDRVEREIARESSLERVLRRAEELGYKKVQEFEYLR